jgi:voltage-gated potassium channel
VTRHHRFAVVVIAAAAVLDTAAGLCFAAVEHRPAGAGLYWAVTTATTVGYGDITPHTAAGHVIAVVVMLTVVPLFAATFSLFTSGLASSHITASEERLKAHLEDRLRHHLDKG